MTFFKIFFCKTALISYLDKIYSEFLCLPQKSAFKITLLLGELPNHKLTDSERVFSGLGQFKGQKFIMESDLYLNYSKLLFTQQISEHFHQEQFQIKKRSLLQQIVSNITLEHAGTKQLMLVLFISELVFLETFYFGWGGDWGSWQSYPCTSPCADGLWLEARGRCPSSRGEYCYEIYEIIS